MIIRPAVINLGHREVSPVPLHLQCNLSIKQQGIKAITPLAIHPFLGFRTVLPFTSQSGTSVSPTMLLLVASQMSWIS